MGPSRSSRFANGLKRENVRGYWLGMLLLASALLFAAAVLAAASGTGGGGLYVPLILDLLHLDARQAVPLSKAMVLGTVVVTCSMNLRKRHPSDPRLPLVAFDAAAFLEPMTMVGTILGVYLNRNLDSLVVVTVMFALLLSLSIRTIAKGMHGLRKEIRAARSSSSRKPDVHAHHGNELEESLRLLDRPSSVSATDLQHLHDEGEKVKLIVKRKFYVQLGAIAATWAVIFLCTYSEWVFQVAPQSKLWWMLQFVIPVFAATLGTTLVARTIKADKFGKFGFLLPVVSSLAGVSAAFLGIGGGMIKGPILLEMGYHPQVAASTSAFMILFTSSLTISEYIIAGSLPFRSSFILFLLSASASFVGNYLVSFFHNTYPSVIVILIGAVMLVASTLTLPSV